MANGRVVVKSAPRADGAIAPERAGPERADRCVETWAAGGRTTRVRAASGTARSHAQAGRSCGLDGRSERLLTARGARKGKPHAVKKKGLAAHPLGKTKPSRSYRTKTSRQPAGQRKSRHAVASKKQGCGVAMDPAYSLLQVGTRPGVHGAPAFSIASWSFTRSTSRRVRSLPRTPANSSPAIS